MIIMKLSGEKYFLRMPYVAGYAIPNDNDNWVDEHGHQESLWDFLPMRSVCEMWCQGA